MNATAQRHSATAFRTPLKVRVLTTATGRLSIRRRHAAANDGFSIQDLDVGPTAAFTPA